MTDPEICALQRKFYDLVRPVFTFVPSSFEKGTNPVYYCLFLFWCIFFNDFRHLLSIFTFGHFWVQDENLKTLPLSVPKRPNLVFFPLLHARCSFLR